MRADTSRTRRCGHVCTALISRNEDHTRAGGTIAGARGGTLGRTSERRERERVSVKRRPLSSRNFRA